MSVQDSINALTGLSADLKAQGEALLGQATAVDKAIAVLQDGYESDQQAISEAVQAKLNAAKEALNP